MMSGKNNNKKRPRESSSITNSRGGGRGVNDHRDKKRNPKNNGSGEDDFANATCSFCGQVPAALVVQVPVLHRKKRDPKPYCLTCYYTTSAVRQDSKHISIANQQHMEEQLPPVQQLFGEGFVELKQQLSEEAARAFDKQKRDPLAFLHQHHAPSKRMVMNNHNKPPPLAGQRITKKAGDASDGGFLRNIPLPERLMKTQQQQARLQQAQISRMNQVSSSSSVQSDSVQISRPDFSKRRKPSKKSIWNLAMESPNDSGKNDAGSEKTTQQQRQQHNDHLPTCSCGSKDVQSFGNITSRNQDLRKGETWGMKDRGEDVVTRYQCNHCGKTWNEEG